MSLFLYFFSATNINKLPNTKKIATVTNPLNFSSIKSPRIKPTMPTGIDPTIIFNPNSALPE